MKLTVRPSKLIEALDFVSSVQPRALSAQQNSSAYLFNCKRERNGRPIGHVYSRGLSRVARAGFELEELQGEGLFTIPTKHIDVIKKCSDDITIEASVDDDEAFTVTLTSPSGMKYESQTFDPRLVTSCDRDLEAAKRNGGIEYHSGLLREALSRARVFFPEDRHVPAHFQTVQVFDQSKPDWAKGDGVLFCSDCSRAFYFQTEDFGNKGLAIPTRQVPLIEDFLSRCPGTTIYRGRDMSFAVNASRTHEKDQVVGWNHETAMHARYAYYSLTRDKYVIIAPKRELLGALDQVETLHDPNNDRVRLVYTHHDPQTGGHTIHFISGESAGQIESSHVSTDDKKDHSGNIVEPSLEEDFNCLVNLDNFRSIIADTVDNFVELRISPIVKDESHPRGGAMLRTIEEIQFDDSGKVLHRNGSGTSTFKCKVTRFMPSSV